MRSPTLSPALLPALLLLASPLVGQQPGEVLSHVKISQDQTGFPGSLANGGQFGVSATDVGDLDGNGTTDLAVGSHRDSETGTDRGSVRILFRNADGTISSVQKITDGIGGFTGVLDDSDRFGVSVCGMGDLNQDGIGDLAVGTYRDDDGFMDAGAVWILFLNADGTVGSHQKISVTEGGFVGSVGASDSFGWAVGKLPDLNGDGVDDLCVGANRDDDGGVNVVDDRGAVYVLFLNTDGTVQSNQKISSTEGGFVGPIQTGDRFGSSVDTIGDFDGDGVMDIAVGAFNDDAGSTDSGAVWILFLNADGTVKGEQKISALDGGFTGVLNSIDRFGVSVSSVGDLNDDGLYELAVGAYGDDDGTPNVGAVWILFLNSDGTVGSHQKISLTEGGFTGILDRSDRFGVCVDGSADLDGDGELDLLVGADLDDDGGVDRGAVYALHLNTIDMPEADFSADVTLGDGPLTVTFTDLSSANTTTWSWDLGDGTISNDQNPVHTYLPGTYTVSLTAGNGDGARTESKTDYLIVSVPPAPAVDFDATPNVGDAPLDVSFTNLASGQITSWSWDFGDGTTSTDEHPQHTYGLPGSYQVTLTVSGLGGSTVESRPSAVVAAVPPAPAPAFTGTPTVGEQPLFVSFSNTTTGHVSSWSWSLGDGTTSTDQDPSHTYLIPGTYTVSLSATGLGGSATLDEVDYIVVQPASPPVVDFGADVTQGDAPLAVAFQDLSTGHISSWSWTFGDGATSTDPNPAHTYALPGTYSVGLTVTGLGGSSLLTRQDWIVVAFPPPPTPLGHPSVEEGDAPLEVTFTDQSFGHVSSWSWTFGDGNTSTEANPTHTYMAEGTYAITLSVAGMGGSAFGILAENIFVRKPPVPVAAFTASESSGFNPLDVVFTDASTSHVSSWSWDFGDGATSSLQNPTHTYTSAGSYTVALTVSGIGGSDSTVAAAPIVVLDLGVTASFTADPSSGLAPLDVVFTDTSTGSLSTWSWDFGDGSLSSLTSPTHTYTVSGVYDVQLAIAGPGGTDTRLESALINVGMDPSFEAQVADLLPGLTWASFFGTEHRIRAGLPGDDNGFPSDGSQWLDLSAEGTDTAIPPASPGMFTDPAVGGAGVSHAFLVPQGMNLLELDAAFLLDGPAGSLAFNDFMSVDVSDGTSTFNVFYADSFTPTPLISTIHGLPMSELTTRGINFDMMFPGWGPDTVFTITMQVGNGGDALSHSRGYVDNLRFGIAQTPAYYGCGVNPAGSLLLLGGTESLGDTLIFGVDNPLGTQGPNSNTRLYVSMLPDPAYPCGTLIPNYGMSGPGAAGELLIDMTPGVLLQNPSGPRWQSAGNPVRFNLLVPNNPLLVGTDVYVQGFIFDGASTFGVRSGLTEAIQFQVKP